MFTKVVMMKIIRRTDPMILKEKGKLEKEIHKIFTEQQAHQNTDNK